MLRRLVQGLVLALPALAQPPAESHKGPVIPVAVAPPSASAGPRFDLSLLPDPLELTAGNAAQHWLHANQAAARGPQFTDKESHWLSVELSLKDLPADEVQRFLDRHKAALQLADRAARYDHCAWDFPPLTVQNANDFFLSDAPSFRQTANLLSLRCRLELSRRQFDKAVHTLQTGFALARHLGEAPALIHQLVGVAVTATLLGRVEEMIQALGAPNLYWALTALPSPLTDIRKACRYEMDTLYRSFPQLRELGKARLRPAEVEKQLDELYQAVAQLDGVSASPWQGKLGFAALAARVYPDARQALIDRGRTPEEVEELPRTQVVLLYYLNRYDRVRDETVKWMALPYWQARPGLDGVEKQLRAARADGNILIVLLFPSVLKAYESQVRIERQLAGMRCVEAVRLHADVNGGRLPAALSEVRAAPLPTDPLTGKGFDAMYRAEGDRAVLDIPAMPGQSQATARRYELASTR